MRMTLLSGVAFLAAMPLAAQNVRAPTQVDTATAGAFDPVVASADELSAVAWVEAVTNNVMVSVSDGRGLAWPAPVRVDGDPGPITGRKDMERDGVAVNGSSVYVLWKDERHNANNDELYFNFSSNGGATWNGEVLVPKNYALLTGSIRDWAMVTSGGNVYVVFTVDPTTNADEEFYLASFSFGSGSFNAPVKVPAGATSTDDVDFFGAAASGLTVHVAWMDDRNGNASFDDVWYQRSVDGGATWNATDVQLDVTSGFGLGDAEDGVVVAAAGSTVLVAWMEELSSATNEELRVAVSTTSGTSWGADAYLGGYNTATADVDLPTAAATGSALYVAWEDNRNVASNDEIWVASSRDQGVTWTETNLSAGANGGFPRVVAHNHVAGVAWSGGTSGAENGLCAFTWNSGNMWTGVVNLSMNAAGDVDNTELALNGRYGNFVTGYMSDELLGGGVNNVFAGGVRNATLTVNGPLSAGNMVNFDLSMFSFDSGAFAGVLLSGGTGAHVLPFGDGRKTGLVADGILSTSLTFIPGPLSAGIGATGSGSTPLVTFPNTLPVGTALFIVAVGFGGTPVTLGNVTDVVQDVVQ